MSAAILHFVGGPKDGVMVAWPDAPPTFYFAELPGFAFHAAPGEVVLPGKVIYERRRGVVGGEAVYDWVAPSDASSGGVS